MREEDCMNAARRERASQMIPASLDIMASDHWAPRRGETG